MGNRVNSVEFLSTHLKPARDPVGRLLSRGDDLLVDLSAATDEGASGLLRAHLDGIIEAVCIITFAKPEDVKEALRIRWRKQREAAD